MTAARELLKSGRSVAVVSTGYSIHNVDYRPFESAGGTLLMGVHVDEVKVSGNKAIEIITDKLGPDTPLQAEWFVLSTGKYFGGGLESDMDRVWEPLLGADVRAQAERFKPNFEDEQPFMRFGVIVDESSRVMVGGEPLSNVFACGEILEGISGADPESDAQIKDSALKVTQQITLVD